MRTFPGSIEERLVEAVKACERTGISPVARQRLYNRILELALGRRPYTRNNRVGA
jgi:hypothetical protein